MTPSPGLEIPARKFSEWTKVSGSALKFRSSGFEASHSCQLPPKAWLSRE